MAYEIVSYRPEFREQVIQLQSALWGPDLDLNRRLFEWKYLRNPYVESPLIFLALSGGEAVGMRGFAGARWRAGEPIADHICLCAGDTVVAREHRRQGLFRKIMETAVPALAAMGYGYLFNFGASPVTYRASISMGWRGIGRYRMLCRQTRGHKVARRMRAGARGLPLFWRFEKSRFGTSDPFLRLDRRSRRREDDGAPISIGRRARADEMAELVARARHDGRLCHVRDREFFDWRYANPTHRYRFFFMGHGELEGYLVLGAPLRDVDPPVNIVDFEAAAPEVLESLLRLAIDLGGFASLGAWTATLPPAYEAVFRSNGFEAWDDSRGISDYRPGVLLRPLGEEALGQAWWLAGLDVLDLASWNLRMIYSDRY